MPTVKLTVEKGKTIQRGEEWTKESYTLEMKVEEAQLEDTRACAISTIDGWLSEMAPATEAKQMPALDPVELTNLPFFKFKEKGPDGKPVLCGPSQAGWNFTDAKELEKLVTAITAVGGSLVVGEWKYKLGGTNNSLIQRVPAKKEKTK